MSKNSSAIALIKSWGYDLKDVAEVTIKASGVTVTTYKTTAQGYRYEFSPGELAVHKEFYPNDTAAGEWWN